MKYFILTALILILLIASGRVYYYAIKNDQQKVIQTTQRKLLVEMQKVYADEKKITDAYSNGKVNSFIQFNSLKTNYPFYIFSDKSLIYWSDEHYNPDLTADASEGWLFIHNSSGQFLQRIVQVKEMDLTILTLIPLFKNYEINNDYISPAYNHKIINATDIRLHKSSFGDGVPIYDKMGAPLFFIALGNEFSFYNQFIHYPIILLETLLALLLLYFTWYHASNKKLVGSQIAIFILGLLVMWAILELARYPFEYEELALFDPKYFASSDFNPSLGKLVINCFLFFLIGFFILKRTFSYLKTHSFFNNQYILLLQNVLAYFVTLSIYYFINLIYVHSNWGLDITHFIEFDIFKGLSYLILLLFGYLSFELIRKVHEWNYLSDVSAPKFLLIQLISLSLFCISSIWFGTAILWIGGLIFILNSLIFITRISYSLKQLSFLSFIYLFILITAISLIHTLSVYYLENQKEANQRNILANRLMNDNDVFAEYMLAQLDFNLKSDQFIRRSFLVPITPYKSVFEKIEKYYLTDYFEKFETKIRIFDGVGNAIYPLDNLTFGASYPVNQMTKRNQRAAFKLYLVGNNESEQLLRRYIYVFEIENNDEVFGKIVIELKPKSVRPDNVFPELLMNKNILSGLSDISYDYALYKNDTLTYAVGSLNFPKVVSPAINRDPTLLNMQKEGDYKFSVVIDNDEKLVFSRPNQFWYRLSSNFSFFFILCFILIFFISFYHFIRIYWKSRNIALSTKIQLYFSLAFLIPLLSVSISTVGFVNATFLKDIVVTYEQSTTRVAEQLTDLVINFQNQEISKTNFNEEVTSTSKIINTDINLYDLDGNLMVTSQPQVFEKNLLSTLINPQAYAGIYLNDQKMITVEEQIGRLNYQSAYVGIRSNNSGELLAILGSPFFKSNKEYDTLLSDLLNNVFNIFVASFIVFMFLAYAATKILTSPLNLLKQKLSQVNLSAENAPISWQIDDEIGLLIREYNQMLLKLEKSKQALSKTEKESAWREMAQQVAHEIKNPLTPMKLSLQHLLVKMKDAEQDMPEATAKINSILSQVDNLSDIATSFSAFAKMPIPEDDRICITDILKKVTDFFQAEHANISLSIPDHEVYVLADRKIIERTFNNMIINALQSNLEGKFVHVDIKLIVLNDKIRVSIADNGSGIEEEHQNKVFLPNFTTKSTGSGIGLAIAKRGIEHAGGKIWFDSFVGKGTIFYIELKKLE